MVGRVDPQPKGRGRPSWLRKSSPAATLAKASHFPLPSSLFPVSPEKGKGRGSRHNHPPRPVIVEPLSVGHCPIWHAWMRQRTAWSFQTGSCYTWIEESL